MHFRNGEIRLRNVEDVFVVIQVVSGVKGFGPQSISDERTGESRLEDVFGC